MIDGRINEGTKLFDLVQPLGLVDTIVAMYEHDNTTLEHIHL
jgi:hypothetical protein